MSKVVCLAFMASWLWACRGDVDVHGVPQSIKLVWPPCEDGQVFLCTKQEAGADAGSEGGQ